MADYLCRKSNVQREATREKKRDVVLIPVKMFFAAAGRRVKQKLIYSQWYVSSICEKKLHEPSI